MATRGDREKSAKQNDRHQAILAELLNDDANKYCADCRSKGPRWASWNLGVFVCIRCAGIHRNLGVHISKMKSVNLDTWTPVQIESVRSKGNGSVNAMYEHGLPDSFRRPTDDSGVEAFIRSKYERKQYYKKSDKPSVSASSSSTSVKSEKVKKEPKKKSSESRAAKTLVTAAVPRPSPGASRAASRSSSKAASTSPDLLGGAVPTAGAAQTAQPNLFAAADPFASAAPAQQAQADVFVGAGTPAQPDLFAAAPTQQPQQDLFASAPANAFAQPQQVSQPPPKDSIMSLYGQGQPQMMAGMGAGVANGMSAGQMAYQQQIYMQQQMQQQVAMQQQLAMQQQQLAMQHSAMQVNQVHEQMARLRMNNQGGAAPAGANGWPAASGQVQQQQQPQQPGQTMNTMLWN